MACPERDVPGALALASELGLDGIELIVQDDYACGISPAISMGDVRTLVATAKATGCPIRALTPYTKGMNARNPAERARAVRELDHCLSMADAFGATAIRVFGGFDVGPGDHGPALARMAEALRALGDRAQRLGDRGDQAEIRAGANDDDRSAGPQPPNRLPQPSRRRPDAVRPGDVVRADHYHRGIRRRPCDEHGVDLPRQPLRRRPHDRLCAQPDPHSRSLGEPPRDEHTRHLVGVLAAVTGGGGVAEDHEVHVEGYAAMPPLGGVAARQIHAVGAWRDVP